MKTIADYIKFVQISEDGDASNGSSDDNETPTNTISSGSIATTPVPFSKLAKRLPEDGVQEKLQGSGNDETNQKDNALLASNVGKYPLARVGDSTLDAPVTKKDDGADKQKLFGQKQQYQNDQMISYD